MRHHAEDRIAQPHYGSGKTGGDWVKQDDIQFCIEIAKVYGCKHLKTDVWNFYKFLFALYDYGKVQGKR